MTVGLQWHRHQKGTGGREDLGQHGGEQQKRREKELVGGAGVRCPLPTECRGLMHHLV